MGVGTPIRQACLFPLSNKIGKFAADLQAFLCCGEDCSCLPVVDNVPKTCSCLPCCFVYPKFGCCPTIADLYSEEQEALQKIPQIKHEFRTCGGVCCGPLCAHNSYCFSPCTDSGFVCCMDGGSTFLCCGQDCAFPCNDDIPKTCGMFCPGLIVWNGATGCGCNCCTTVKDMGFEIEGGSNMADGGVASAGGAPEYPNQKQA